MNQRLRTLLPALIAGGTILVGSAIIALSDTQHAAEAFLIVAIGAASSLTLGVSDRRRACCRVEAADAQQPTSDSH